MDTQDGKIINGEHEKKTYPLNLSEIIKLSNACHTYEVLDLKNIYVCIYIYIYACVYIYVYTSEPQLNYQVE